MCLAAGPLPALLLVAVSSGGSFAAVGATGLTDAVGPGAAVRCLPMQYRDGAAAYRDCVAGEDDSAPAVLDALSFAERHALERACTDAADPGSCADAELASLEGTLSPFLDALHADDRNAILRQCFAAQGSGGVAVWRRCLDDALATVEALPAPELAALSPSERGALAIRCVADGDTAADYRRCRLAALGTPLADVTGTTRLADASSSTAPETLSDAPANAIAGALTGASADARADAMAPKGTDLDTDADGASTDDPADAARDAARDAVGTTTRRVTLPADPTLDDGDPATDDPRAGEPIVTAQSTPATGAAEPLEDPADAPPPDLGQRVSDARDRLAATVSDLDGTERIVLFAALALPLLLLALWALGRGRRAAVEPEPSVPVRNTALVDRVAPSMQQAGGSGFHDDDEVSDDDFFADVDRATGVRAGATAGDRTGGRTGHDLERDRAAFIALDDTDAFGDDDSGLERIEDREADLAVGTAPLVDDEAVPHSTFGRWLSTRDRPLRQQYAIEFLIYWMAYGDERYEPAQAEALLRDGGDDGDPHDLIKRHVLEEDTPAFADVVRWVQGHCNELERVQIIDLLMVLLVGEEAMTPVQNTLLHFLADAFGLGAEGLEQRHEEAFGEPMPALARADLDAWWERVEPGRPPRWDARSVAALDERDRHRVRLGLPLDEALGSSRITEAFRHAARRCQPHRFDALGERERALVERQLAKFEEARDRLLGVGA